MTTYPNCKINLGLHVVGRRPDGYHDLETLFIPVPDLCDELEITELSTAAASSSGAAQAPRMTQSGIALDNAPDDNLCIRAWHLLHDEFGIPAVHIRLKKRIPFGAGLGGGSSDAAFTLRMLNDMFSLGLGTADLERRAARLGADCAFFIQNRPAYATGIGDQLEPIEWKVESGKWKIVIEIPDGEHVSTKEAYAGLKLPGCSPSQGELSTGLRGTPCHVNTPSPLRGTTPQEGESLQGPSGCSPSQGEVSEGLRGTPCRVNTPSPLRGTPHQEGESLQGPSGCFPSQGELSEGLRGTPCYVNTPSPLRGTPPQEWESLQGPSGCSPSQGELSAGLRGKQRPDLRQAIRRPIEEWRHLIVNDFEASVFPAHPAIAALKDDFYRRGALYASMTGSGAAVFGIFAR